MASFPVNKTPCFSLPHVPSSFSLKLGKRGIFICRDFYRRHYQAHLFLECRAGSQPGHSEFLLFRTWLIILSKVPK